MRDEAIELARLADEVAALRMAINEYIQTLRRTLENEPIEALIEALDKFTTAISGLQKPIA